MCRASFTNSSSLLPWSSAVVSKFPVDRVVVVSQASSTTADFSIIPLSQASRCSFHGERGRPLPQSFTNDEGPVGESVSIIHERLREDETLGDRTSLFVEQIANLLKMCLKSIYFSFGGNFYEQKEGAAMGSPVSAVVANLYMEFFEELALETALTRPRLWKRCVDDTFYILRKGSIEALLRHLNGVRPIIKFTVEQEEDGTLPFLGTLLRRREDGSLDLSVYRKPIHMDWYLHFDSHHPTHVKRGLVKCLHDRARGIINT